MSKDPVKELQDRVKAMKIAIDRLQKGIIQDGDKDLVSLAKEVEKEFKSVDDAVDEVK